MNGKAKKEIQKILRIFFYICMITEKIPDEFEKSMPEIFSRELTRKFYMG